MGTGKVGERVLVTGRLKRRQRRLYLEAEGVAGTGEVMEEGERCRLRVVEEKDLDVVRDLWAEGLRGNIERYGYPEGLRKEEEEFVGDTLEGGDMRGIESLREKWSGERGIFVVAEKRASIVGCLGVMWKEGETCELGKFTVIGAERGSGVGNRMLHAAERWVKSKGWKKVTATTVGMNAAAVKCYGKNGYKETFRGRKDGKVEEPDFVQFTKVL